MSLFRYIWYISLRAFLPLYARLIRLRCRCAKYGCWEAGTCVFYGPPDFLAVCSSAMERLSTLDRSLYGSLLAKKLTFWYEPQRLAVAERHYGISEAFVLWKEQGVIACLVFEHFEVELAWRRPLWRLCLMDRHIVWGQIHAAVRSWLEEHHFADELVRCFS